MDPLRIALLGTPRIEVGGRPLEVDTRKATAMLAFLAVTGHAHSRAVVANLLWPEAPPERSRAALRRTLSTLRTALGEDRLTGDRESLSLDLSGAWFDVAEARRVGNDPGAALEELSAACDLHRDDLLAGFGLRDSVEFDDWQGVNADLLRRERAGLLDRLVAALAAARRFDDAVARAQQRLTLDPLHEPTHRRLIELYAAAGRRGDAFTQYRDCVRILSRELGVQPLAETTELYRAISAGTAPAPVEAEPAAPTEVGRVAELPLVGRATELARITDAHGAIGDGGRVVVIEGESGAGKTRLAREALSGLARHGVPLIEAHPNAGERGLAYGVLAELLREAVTRSPESVSEPLRADVARLLPDLGSAPASSLEEAGARQRFLESVSHVLAATFGDGPGVVFVDDLHWCDPASLDALTYFARRLSHRPVLLLAARRTDEPDPGNRGARLADEGERVAIGRLSRADVLALASRSGLDDARGDEVFRESEGLPLFVAELLSATGDTTGGGVRAVLDARLDAVGEAAAQVLGAAALIGRRFDADAVRAASGRSEDEVTTALDELAARALISIGDGGYDFGHEWLRAAAEDRIGLARRRLLHGRIADALTARRDDPAVVARHLELAGRDADAAAAYAEAADRARALSAAAEAVAHYETALALGHPEPAALTEAIGDLLTLQGEYGRALSTYDAAAAIDPNAHTGRLEHKLGAVHERRGDWQLAETHYQEALRLGADPAVVQSDRSRVAWRSGDATGARKLGFEALELATKAGAIAAAAQANNILGLLGCGREYLEQSLELSAELPDPSIRIAALNNLALASAVDGALDEAEGLIREAVALCSAQGDRHHLAALRNNLADVLHKSGQRDGAMEELKHAATAFAAIGAEGGELYPGVWSLVDW